MSSFKAREIVRILEKLGFVKKRQTGSHLILHNPKRNITIPVPIHTKELKRGLVKAIIKQVDSTEKEFLKLK